MANRIYQQYHDLFKKIISEKTDKYLKMELVEILADMKTTIHLLCAAYLDYTRYKEPDFLISLPQFCPDTVSEFDIDMRGDITGSNWSEPGEKGRWTGEKARSSVLLPNPGPGKYAVRINVANEKRPGDLEKLRVYVNGAKIPFHKVGDAFPCALSGEIIVEKSPFLAFHFQFDSSERQLPPDKKNPRSLLIEKLNFTKKQ